MKKIDFHVHTIPVDDKDANFEFDLTKFAEYASALSINAFAVTNHNIFDLEQFKKIVEALHEIVVFPGIEIDFEDGHLLMISENEDLDDFNRKCESVKNEFKNGNIITADKLKEIFGDLGRYLLIPHYDKRPKVRQNAIDSLRGYIFAGEVQSPKKFHRIIKEPDLLTPVVFGDARIGTVKGVRYLF